MTAARNLAKLARYLVTGTKLDLTPESLLKTGDFGLGGDAIALASNVNWDTITTPGEYYIPLATGSTAPLSSGNWFVKVLVNGTVIKQMAYQQGTAATYQRVMVTQGWQAWDGSIARGGIVGTVSQTGGVPTGAIISNVVDTATGIRVIKWADGTCHMLGAVVSNSATANSITTVAVNLPAGVMANTNLVLAVASPNTTWDWYGVTYAFFTNLNQINMYVRNGATAQNFSISYVAIGRWYS